MNICVCEKGEIMVKVVKTINQSFFKELQFSESVHVSDKVMTLATSSIVALGFCYCV